MEEQYLTVKEVAALKGCSERNIRLLIESEKLVAEAIKPEGQSPGRGGIQYRIPLSALDDKLQLKYKRMRRKAEKDEQVIAADGEAAAEIIPLQSLSGAEREEIAFWKSLLKEWHTYRYIAAGTKEEADTAFIAICNEKYSDLKLTRRILYRKWQLLNEQGEIALLDKRGKHNNHNRKIKSQAWDIFEYYYLDESRKSIKLCVTLTELELKKNKPELLPLPSVATFSRAVKEIPEPYILYFRYGEKVFRDKCAPYIRRTYEDLAANDIWVADNHTFDIMVYDGEKPIRLYLTGFMDVRSRKMTGWCVTDRPCSDATLFALRNGIEKYGIPKQIYTDNGREFLTHDIGGNGFRKKKKDGQADPPTILKELEIEFKTALPRNARAKGIERAFRNVKDSFSKLFDAYTGGTILERPGNLKEVVKNPDLMKEVEEFKQFVDIYINGWFNKQPHQGDGMNGKCPDEVFAALLVEQRRATPEQLELMFMRWSKPVTVGKNGVTLTFYGKKLQYKNDYLWSNYCGKRVYVRYSPDDLNSVRVYDMDEKLICTAELDTQLGYNATKENVAAMQREKRHTERTVTAYKKQKNIQTTEALDLIMEQAEENIMLGEDIDPKVLRPFFGDNALPMAAGDEGNNAPEIDWTSALENLKTRKGMDDDQY